MMRLLFCVAVHDTALDGAHMSRVCGLCRAMITNFQPLSQTRPK